MYDCVTLSIIIYAAIVATIFGTITCLKTMMDDSVLNLSPEIRHTQYYTPTYLLHNRLDNIDYCSNIGKPLQPYTVPKFGWF